MLTVAILGPLTVTVDDRPIDLTAGRLRALVAVLAMSAGRPVPTDHLAAALWDDEQPAVVRRAVHTYLSRLRAALGTVAVSAEPTGYRLHADPDRVDALRFLRLLDDAAGCTDPAAELTLIDDALRLWRGTPFTAVPSDWLVRTETPRLVERRLAAVERRVDLWLAGGSPDGRKSDPPDGRWADIAAELRELTAQYPYRETLWVRLLELLHRRGRTAEALAQYASIRARLSDELGTDPGPELRRVHAILLAGEPPSAGDADTTPRQLPAPPQLFTGRTAELAALTGAQDGSTVVIRTVDGMAGIGKTALAVHAAHRVADRYPDGQLYIDLHGHTEGVVPADPADALDELLRSLGVPGPRIPAGLAARSALYRTHLARRRVLLVLDNAATETQVQPLLPGSAGCLVLVTSRRRLAGLDHMSTVSLDALPTAHAVELFVRTVGESRLSDRSTDLLTSTRHGPTTGWHSPASLSARRSGPGRTGSGRWASSPRSVSTTPTTRRPRSRSSAPGSTAVRERGRP